MTDYSGQVVMITGASGGLGKEAAKQFGLAGAQVAISDVNEEGLAACAEALRGMGIEVFYQACDVTDEQAVQSFVEGTVAAFGRIDAAVNNAGIDADHHLLADTPTADFDRTMNINVKGVFLCMKHQIPVMLAQGEGAICNISSVAGVGGAPHMSAYAASKHAVIGLTKSAAFEYGKKGIRINAVCPFVTMTAMLEQTLDTMPDREQALKYLSKGSALKRVAQPEEVVHAMLFACDKKNSYMCGHELVIDGGMTAI